MCTKLLRIIVSKVMKCKMKKLKKLLKKRCFILKKPSMGLVFNNILFIYIYIWTGIPCFEFQVLELSSIFSVMLSKLCS
jgi:hypothetical protein